MKTGTKESSMGTKERKSDPDKVRRAWQEGEDATKEGSARGESQTPSIQSGEAHNPGLDHPGDRAMGPGLEHPGRGQEARWQPPGLEHPEGRGAQKRH